MTKSPDVAKIEIANTQLSVCFERVFFPEHCAFCLKCTMFEKNNKCEVLTRCHRHYVELTLDIMAEIRLLDDVR